MRINVPGIGIQDINIEDINIEDIVGRTPKTLPKKNIPKPPVNKAKKTSPKKKRAEKKVKKRLGRSPRRSMRDIDLAEIAEIAPPKAPVVVKPKAKKKKTTPKVGRPKVIKGKKTRPVRVDTTPKPKAPSVPSSKDVEKIIADLGIEIPELIDIPGVGQVRIPSVPAAPKAPVSTQPDTIIEPSPTAPTPTGSYESSYIDWLESKPEKPTVRRLGRMPGGGPAYKRAQEQYRKDLANWKASKPTRDSFTAPTPTPSPVETLPVETPLPVEDKPKPPTSPPVNPFEGFVPRNILAPSFDPKDVSAQQKMVADARARQTPGGYLTYDNPILGNKQTQFGGYGQPMPTAPLMNYAGLSSPITYSTLDPDPDAQPGGPPPPPPISSPGARPSPSPGPPPTPPPFPPVPP